MATGSDTRMYSPRSESNLGYSKDDDDYKHGGGDPEQMEIMRDKKQAEKEKPVMSETLPHLQITIPKQDPPMMPPLMEEEEDPLEMSDQFNEGQQFGAMTGMPDMGNLSIGDATGTMPAPGGMLATGEPMEDAWSSLMKSKLDEAGRSKDKTWRQPQFEIQPGGARIETATSRRSKQQSRTISPGKKRGLDRAPLAVHRTHLGVETKQPLRLDAQKYGQQQATQARRKLMGNIPQTPTGHGIGAETDYNPRVPKVGGSGQIKEPKAIREKGKSFGKSVEGIRADMEEVRKKMNYMQFTQMRRLMRDLKDALERREKSKKAAAQGGHGNNREAGHREAQDSTTKPEGATENLEDDPKNWGAPSLLFAAKGSGRVG
tara:strand:+ start:3416 stop:4537 length:1122 start_codon:yes stop_codon:yes gene_type:complete